MSEQLSNEPKFYKGGKSKALRALRGFGEHAEASADKLLFQNAETGEWGFYPLDAKAAQTAGEAPVLESKEGEVTHEGTPAPLVDVLPPGPTNEDVVQPKSEEQSEPQGPNVFGATLGQLTNDKPSTPAPVARAASRTSYTIERNRPEQNGIKRPSAGGLCRAVWDACDDLRSAMNNGDADGPNIPDSKQIKELAQGKGWNKNNAMIEFYQWRKYNGITGRSAKKADVPAPAPTPAPTTQVQTQESGQWPVGSSDGEGLQSEDRA